jgi:hypothetical protein
LGDFGARPFACAGVGGEDRVQRIDRLRATAFQAGGNHCRDVEKTDAVIEEGSDRLFVRRIEYRRSGAAGAQRIESQAQTGEALEVGTLEVQAGDLEQVERPYAGIDALGQAMALAIGVRMSGLPSWAITEPSA